MTISEDYYNRIKKLNIKHYAGEVAYYSVADLRPAELALLKTLTPKARILDVGCGSGRFSIGAAKLGFLVSGIDITPDAIDACKLRAKQAGLKNTNFQVTDITEVVPDKDFDYVFCTRFVINAIATDDRRRLAITNMQSACRPGGRVFIESFNLWYAGKGPVVPLKNVSKSMFRKLRISVAKILHSPYNGLFPGDIVYMANKVETASIGYAHLPTIFEVKSYLNAPTKSIYEIIGQKNKDYLKAFRYSIWTFKTSEK